MEKKIEFLFTVLIIYLGLVESTCKKGCDLALASYYIYPGATLLDIAIKLHTTPPNIMNYNPQIPNENSIDSGSRINIPFSCDCINGDYLGHSFSYQIESGDTYISIAGTDYANLTSVDRLKSSNDYPSTNLPVGRDVNVPVNCSCGDSSVSKEYGLFVTYPLRVGDSLNSIARQTNVSASLLQQYNPGVNFGAGNGIVFIPGRGENRKLSLFTLFVTTIIEL